MYSLKTECLRQLINGKEITITHCNEKSGHVVMQSIENQMCDQQTEGSTACWTPLRSNLARVIHIYVLLSPSSILWYWPQSSYAQGA